ncbi:helix-turn-helix transcriptional regulator [Cryobacterium suzukii]|uniref:helix-turn-helix transcriptional regulator n=1 Tax=Cryobacterium suzukii TaxID=1259198 RepID=UPI001F53ED5E|nr:hypothetical protein [Cryobacterium suzukii]
MDTTTQITPTFLTQRELAELLRMPERTLENWRLMQTGPPYLKLGRSCVTSCRTCSLGFTNTAMVRPQIMAGEVASIDVQQLASGRYRARGTSRDDSGARHRHAVTADTRDEAIAEIYRQARAMATGGSGALSPSSTIADTVELWLSQVLTRAEAGSLSYSTCESYETTARVIIVPRCGGVRLDHLTVGRCDRILQRILEEETISKRGELAQS